MDQNETTFVYLFRNKRKEVEYAYETYKRLSIGN